MVNKSQSKLGSHVDKLETDHFADRFYESGCKVAFVTYNNGLVAQLSKNKDVYIGTRHWDNPGGDDWHRSVGMNDPKTSAQDWWNITYKHIEEVSKAGGDLSRVYWQAINEPVMTNKDGLSAFEWMKRYAEFEAERCRIASNNGWKAQIGNFAVGNPHIKTYRRRLTISNKGFISVEYPFNYYPAYNAEPPDGNLWYAFEPALEEAHKGKHLLGLHEYMGAYPAHWYAGNQDYDAEDGSGRIHIPHDGYLTDKYADGWLLCRYRKVWREHIERNGWGDIRILISETGSDNAGGSIEVRQWLRETTGNDYIGAWTGMIPTWRKLFPEFGYLSDNELYLEMLKWYDRQLRYDFYVVGACVFAEGVWDQSSWGGFNIAGTMADLLYSHIKSNIN